MRVTTYQGERQLSDLARRLFEIKGSKAKELTKEAEAALLRANPHLKDLKHVPDGTVLVVPDVPGTTGSGDTADPDIGTGQLAEELRRVREAAQQAMERNIADLTQQAKTTMELQKSPELKKLGERDRTIPEQLTKVGAEAKRGLEEAKALAAAHGHTFVQLDKDLKDFLKQFGLD